MSQPFSITAEQICYKRDGAMSPGFEILYHTLNIGILVVLILLVFAVTSQVGANITVARLLASLILPLVSSSIFGLWFFFAGASGFFKEGAQAVVNALAVTFGWINIVRKENIGLDKPSRKSALWSIGLFLLMAWLWGIVGALASGARLPPLEETFEGFSGNDDNGLSLGEREMVSVSTDPRINVEVFDDPFVPDSQREDLLEQQLDIQRQERVIFG